MNETEVIPETWPELLDAHRSTTTTLVSIHERRASELKPARGKDLAEVFGGSGSILARGLVVLGPQLCEGLSKTLCQLFPPALDGIEPIVHEQYVTASYLIAFETVVECTGHLWPDALKNRSRRLLRELVKERSQLTVYDRRSLALAAIAAGELELAFDYLGEKPLVPFETAQVFESNTHGFIRYAATAVSNGAPPDALSKAWSSFVATFPLNLAADTIDWCDLLFAARVVAVLAGNAIGDVANDLHRKVSSGGDALE